MNDAPATVDPALLLWPVDRLGLGARAHHALIEGYGAGLTVGALCGRTAHELMQLPGFGHHSLADVRQCLAGWGMRLVGDDNTDGGVLRRLDRLERLMARMQQRLGYLEADLMRRPAPAAAPWDAPDPRRR